MTISRSSTDGVKFDDVQHFHELHMKNLPKQSHVVTIASNRAASAHDLAVEHFHAAANLTRKELESAMEALKIAVDESDKVETTTAKRRAKRMLQARMHEKCQVTGSVPVLLGPA